MQEPPLTGAAATLTLGVLMRARGGLNASRLMADAHAAHRKGAAMGRLRLAASRIAWRPRASNLRIVGASHTRKRERRPPGRRFARRDKGKPRLAGAA